MSLFERIVCAIGLKSQERARHLIKISKELLSPGGTLYLVHALEEFPVSSAGNPAGIEDPNASKLLAAAERSLAELSQQLSVPAVLRVRTGGAARTILDVAEEIDADLIVVSAHEQGLLSRLFGSTADKVAREARCSIHICR
ncbi:universal stress protein [Rhizobium sp. BK376]|uniref:universal stress protein n=1 Tax=Rhizobium sp. BK376 TaxID=2512149 RepID=UPI00104AEA43|nr:universal stress protein [Rhizobium sp. BK376]TCR75632.1 nucleotide-binding universal stress UspA family protein [Rhizobium sp. BK376]